MATNDFLPFGTGAGANVLDQAAYAALAARLNGFQAGVASSEQVNKAIRQAAFMAAMVGQFTADYGGDARDDGDLATLEANFKAALAAWIASGESPVDLSNYVLRAGDTMTGAFVAPAGFRTAARLLSSSSSLAASDHGKLIEITGAASLTQTFPTPISVGGARITVWNNTVYTQTISTPSGSFVGPSTSGTGSMSMLPADVWTFVSDGYNWVRVGRSDNDDIYLPKQTLFSSSGTFSKNARAEWILAIVQAGGGAGGGASDVAPNAAGSGGGAGECRIWLYDAADIASSVLCAPGAGGAGVYNGDGGSGSDSTFGSYITAKGGYGGGRNSSSGSTISQGGSGGIGGVGFSGGGGGSSSGGTGGIGGSGLFAAGGRAGNGSQGFVEGGLGSRGGGGGGADGAAAGGNGGSGFVWVWEI